MCYQLKWVSNMTNIPNFSFLVCDFSAPLGSWNYQEIHTSLYLRLWLQYEGKSFHSCDLQTFAINLHSVNKYLNLSHLLCISPGCLTSVSLWSGWIDLWQNWWVEIWQKVTSSRTSTKKLAFAPTRGSWKCGMLWLAAYWFKHFILSYWNNM